MKTLPDIGDHVSVTRGIHTGLSGIVVDTENPLDGGPPMLTVETIPGHESSQISVAADRCAKARIV